MIYLNLELVKYLNTHFSLLLLLLLCFILLAIVIHIRNNDKQQKYSKQFVLLRYDFDVQCINETNFLFHILYYTLYLTDTEKNNNVNSRYFGIVQCKNLNIENFIENGIRDSTLKQSYVG